MLSICLSLDGRWALSGSEDDTLRLWDVAAFCVRGDAGFCAPPMVSRVTSAERVLAARAEFDKAIGGARQTLASGDYVAAIELARTARAISGFGRTREVLQLWAELARHCKRRGLRDSWQVRTFAGHSGAVRSVRLSPDGRWALSGSRDRTVRLWEVATGRCVQTFEGHADDVTSVSFGPDGRSALSASLDKTLRLWEVSTGHCVRAFEGHKAFVDSACQSLDGQWALSGGSDNTLRLWEVSTGHCLRTLEGHSGAVSSVCLSPDDRWALSASYDRTLRLWEVSTGQCVRTFEGHANWVTSVCLSPDGCQVLSGSRDQTLRLWESSTGRCVRLFEGHTGAVNSVSISPDGRWALSGGFDNPRRLWEVATGRCVRTFEGHTGDTGSVSSLSDDGCWAAWEGPDNTFQLWELDWELQPHEPTDFDEAAVPLLQNFLRRHTPRAGQIPADRQPTEEEIRLALTPQGMPRWTDADIERLLYALGCAGFGWLRPESVRCELERMCAGADETRGTIGEKCNGPVQLGSCFQHPVVVQSVPAEYEFLQTQHCEKCGEQFSGPPQRQSYLCYKGRAFDVLRCTCGKCGKTRDFFFDYTETLPPAAQADVEGACTPVPDPPPADVFAWVASGEAARYRAQMRAPKGEEPAGDAQQPGAAGEGGGPSTEPDKPAAPVRGGVEATIPVGPAPPDFTVLEDQKSPEEGRAEPGTEPWEPSLKDPVRPASARELDDARHRFDASLKSNPELTAGDLSSVRIVQAVVHSVLDMEIAETLELRRLLEVLRVPKPDDRESNPILTRDHIGSIWNWPWLGDNDSEMGPILLSIPESIRFVGCKQCKATGRGPCECCQGTGTVPCRRCGGSGEHACFVCRGSRIQPGTTSIPCQQCLGSGMLPCAACRRFLADNQHTVWLVENMQPYNFQLVRFNNTMNRFRCPDCDGGGVGRCAGCHGSGRQVDQLLIEATRWKGSGKRRISGQEIAAKVDNPAELPSVWEWTATPAQRQMPILGDGSILAAFREMNNEIQKSCPLETSSNRAIDVVEMTLRVRGFAVLGLRYQFKGQEYDAWMTQGDGPFTTSSPFVSRDKLTSLLETMTQSVGQLKKRLLVAMGSLSVVFLVVGMDAAGFSAGVCAAAVAILALLGAAETLHGASIPLLLRTNLPRLRNLVQALMLRKGDYEALVEKHAPALKSIACVSPGPFTPDDAVCLPTRQRDISILDNLRSIAGCVALAVLAPFFLALAFARVTPLSLGFAIVAAVGQFACLLLLPQIAKGERIPIRPAIWQLTKFVPSLVGLLIVTGLFEGTVVAIVRFLLSLVLGHTNGVMSAGVLAGLAEGVGVGMVYSYFAQEKDKNWNLLYGMLLGIPYGIQRAANGGLLRPTPVGDMLFCLSIGIVMAVFLVLRLCRDRCGLSEKLPKPLSSFGFVLFALSGFCIIIAGVLHALLK